MRPGDVRVVFMGSPSFAVPSLQALAAAGYTIAGVVTQPDRPAGRGGRLREPEVKMAARELGLTVLQPASMRGEAIAETLRELAPDLFVVAAYGRILPDTVLAVPKRGSVNVHSSLLPRWRGASPVTAAILAGDAETGVSIMELVSKMDAGPVIARRAIPMPPDATTGSLEPVIAELGAGLLVESLPGWLDGSIAAEPQDEALVTYCRTLKKDDGHLRAAMTATEAERAVRAYQPWPGAFVVYRDEPLKILAGHVVDGESDEPGALSVMERKPAIVFAEGVLVVDNVQKAGKRPVDGRSFLNGERGDLPESVGLA